jgi:hypothetical protein
MSEALRAVVGGTVSLPPPPVSTAAWVPPPSLAPPAKRSSILLPVLISGAALGILAVTAVGAVVFWPREGESPSTATTESGKHSELVGSSSGAASVVPAKPGTAPRTSDAGVTTSGQIASAQKQAADARKTATDAQKQAADARAQAEAAKKKALESIGK